jgi:hypothetical protein
MTLCAHITCEGLARLLLPQAYGKTTYLITSLQLVPRGTEGAVSLEGTLAGLGAAAVYAAAALALGQVRATQPSVCLDGCRAGWCGGVAVPRGHGRRAPLARCVLVARRFHGWRRLPPVVADHHTRDAWLPPPHTHTQASTVDVGIITGSAFVANVFESYLGAALQGRVAWLTNDLVNVIQISVAAALAVTSKFYLAAA